MNNLTLSIILRFITDQFNSAINGARNQLTNLGGNAQNADTSISRFQTRVNQTSRSILDFAGALRGLIAGFSLLALFAGTKELIHFADSLRLIEGRVKNASDGTVDFAKNYAQLVAISYQTGTSFAENATMFGRINSGIKAMGGESSDTLRQVDLLSKSMRISGTATSESASVIRQWSQAMASGLLRGDEFNSIMENSPRIAKAIADGLHINIGVLRTMAEAGELTAVKVGKALASQGKIIDDEFKKIPLTIGVAFEKVKTAFGQYIADADRGQGATAGLATSIQTLADNLPVVIDSLLTITKITAVIFTGSAIVGITNYIAAKHLLLIAYKANIAMSALHSEALLMDLQRTADLTAVNVLAIETEIAATEARLAGTLSMGERMAVTDALNLQTQSLMAATLAQTEANAAMTASSWTLGGALKALPFAALNLAMAATVGYMIGDWARSFETVRKAAIFSVDAVVSALADLEYHIKKAGLLWELKFTFNEEGIQKLNKELNNLETEFSKEADAQNEFKNNLLDAEGAAKKVVTEIDNLIESYRNIKTPQDTFIEKSRKLTEEFNKGSLLAKEYNKILLDLQNAMQMDIAKQQTPFQKEQASLLDKKDKANLSPEDYQRKQYEKTFSKDESDTLMALQTPTKAEQKRVEKVDNAEEKAIIKSTLDAEISEIKEKQKAEKNSYDSKLIAIKTVFNAQKLALDEQVYAEKLTQIEADEKLIALKEALATKELNLKKDLVLKTTSLEKEAIQTRINAVKNEPIVNKDTKKSVVNLDVELEKAAKTYGFNLEAVQAKFAQVSQSYGISEKLLKAQAYSESGFNPKAKSGAGATGFSQFMPDTAKRFNLKNTSDPIASIEAQAKYMRVLIDIFGNETKALAGYNWGEGKKNSPHRSSIQNNGKLPDETSNYVKRITNLTSGESGDSTAAQQVKNEKIKALNSELIANENDKNTQLKALGFEEKNNITEQAAQQLALLKEKTAQEKSLTEESNSAAHAALLDGLALKEVAAQQELDLGNITHAQHLAKLRDFATERLNIERQLLAEKSKLLDNDALALAKNLHDKEALERNYTATLQSLDNQAAMAQQESFKKAFSPLENALNQSVNGILTGQQTVKNAVKNAAQSVVVSYAETFIKTRMMSAAQWAWEVSGFSGKEAKEKAILSAKEVYKGVLFAKEKTVIAAQWLWEAAGFAKKEATEKNIANSGMIFQTALWAKEKAALAAKWVFELSGFTKKEAKEKSIKQSGFLFDTLHRTKEKIALGIDWASEATGFATKEATKAGSKVAGEAVQTGAQITGDVARTSSTVAANAVKKTSDSSTAESSIMAKAYGAAAGVYDSLAGIPYVGWILAPIAAAATFAVVAGWSVAAGSAKGGEWEVGEDGSPYILHEKESVLPAGVAENFRQITKNHVADNSGSTSHATAISVVDKLNKTGQLAKVSLPHFATNLSQHSQTTANNYARDRINADKSHREITHAKTSKTTNFLVNSIPPEEFFSQNSHLVIKAGNKEARKFNQGNKR